MVHTPSAEPRPSIFFDYRVHPYRPPAGHAAQVVVVGAGPVGLVTAINAARFGAQVVVLEQELQVSLGSRATTLTRRTVDILRQAGVAAPFLAKGLPWGRGRTFYRGREVYSMVIPQDGDDPFPPMLNIQQQYMEQYLVDAAAAMGTIDVRWGHRLTGLRQSVDRVTLRVDTPDGEHDLSAAWVVAADGGRSAARRLMGLRMEGRAYGGSFVILDIRVPLDLPTERLCFFSPDWNPGANVLMHRLPDGLWRLDFKLPDDEDAAAALRPERLAERVRAILAMTGYVAEQGAAWQIDWAAVYSASTLTLARYRHGRVLFAGDAAHLLPIFGVRGANTGFQDADNLGWKLGLVASGRARASLLDSYDTERVAAAREICEEGGRSTRFMTPPTEGFRLLREAALSFTLSEDFTKDLLHWRTSRPHVHHGSPLNSAPAEDAAFAGGFPCGAAIGNARLGQDGFLLDHLRPGFQVILAAERPDEAACALLRAAAGTGLPVHRTVVGPRPRDWDGLAEAAVQDEEGRFAAKFAAPPGAAYVTRPDLHVCARFRRASPDGIAHALQAAAGAA